MAGVQTGLQSTRHHHPQRSNSPVMLSNYQLTQCGQSTRDLAVQHKSRAQLIAKALHQTRTARKAKSGGLHLSAQTDARDHNSSLQPTL